MSRSELITNVEDVPAQAMRISRTGEALGLAAMLSEHLGLRRLRIQHERLPAGHRSSSPHAHTTREEFIYILEGHPDVWIDGHLHPLRPGDSVAFLPGTGIAHTLINNSDHDAVLIAVATEDADDRCFYPFNPTSDIPQEIAEEWSSRPRGPHPGTARATQPGHVCDPREPGSQS